MNPKELRDSILDDVFDIKTRCYNVGDEIVGGCFFRGKAYEEIRREIEDEVWEIIDVIIKSRVFEKLTEYRYEY